MSATFPSLNHVPRHFSDHDVRAQSPTKTSGVYLGVLRLLCATGLGITGYLAYASLMTGEVAGCSGGEVWDCGHVLHSRWAKLFGVPVSVPAFAVYSILLGSLVACRSSSPEKRRRLAWYATTVCALSAGMAALWFVALQIFDVGRLCVYCLGAHACGIALCAAILWKRPLGTRTTALLSSISLAGVSFMIGGQLLATPPATYKIERFVDETEIVPQAESTVSVTDTPAAPVPSEQHEVEVFEPF